MSHQYFEKRQPDRNQQRFYRLSLVPTLFNEWCLIRDWGRIGRSGQRAMTTYDDPAQAEAALERKARQKQRRGYVPQPDA